MAWAFSNIGEHVMSSPGVHAGEVSPCTQQAPLPVASFAFVQILLKFSAAHSLHVFYGGGASIPADGPSVLPSTSFLLSIFNSLLADFPPLEVAVNQTEVLYSDFKLIWRYLLLTISALSVVFKTSPCSVWRLYDSSPHFSLDYSLILTSNQSLKPCAPASAMTI